MRRFVWLGPALVWVAGCASTPRVTCDVDLTDAAASTASVACSAENLPAGPVVFKQMAQDALVQVSDFAAATADGDPLAVETRPDQSMGSDARRFTERVAPRQAHGDFLTYRYRVHPGAWTGDAVTGAYAKRFGFLDAHGALLSGRNLFLLPSWYRSIREIRVTFRLPPSWGLVGSLPQEQGAIRTTGAERAAAAIVEGVIGAGPFEEMSDSRPGSTLHLFLHHDIAAPTREKLWQAVNRGYSFLESRLGALNHDFTIVLIPTPVDGSMVLVPFGSSGFGSEIASGGPVQLYDLMYGMARAWTSADRSSFKFSVEDQWLNDAIPTYQAVAALEQLGIRSSRESWLMRSRSARQGSGSLTASNPRAGGEDWLQSRRAKGAYLLALVDEVVMPQPAGHSTVTEAIKDLQRRDDGRGFFDTLSSSARASLKPVRDIAASPRAIPAEWIARATGVAPLHLTATPQSREAGGGTYALRILVTAGTRGMLEVCGCVARQFGGIARRETVRRASLGQASPFLMIDLGNAFPCDSKEPMMDAVENRELALSLELLGMQDYAAMAIGHFELLRGANFFGEMTREHPLRYVNANLQDKGRALAPPTREVKVGATRVGLVSVLEPRQYTGDHARFYEEHLRDLEVGDPVSTLAAQAVTVRQKSDLVVAIGSLSPPLVRRILEEIPAVDAILSTEGPDAALDGVFSYDTDGETRLMGFYKDRLVFFSTAEGRAVEEIAIGLNQRGRIQSAEVTEHLLSEAVPDAPAFRKRLTSFYDELKGDPIISGSEEPVARVLPTELGATEYVGAAKCRACHESEWNDWSQSPHSSAFAVLLSRHRNYAPRCVGCHVTGYGYQRGYRIGDPLERLRHVQCEMCHGPGGNHFSAPTRLNIRREPPPAACFECHTPNHSNMSKTNFEDYYLRTRHGSMHARTGESPAQERLAGQ